jgi:hypothetical protein
MEELGTRRSTRSAVASETNADSHAAGARWGEGWGRGADDGGALDERLEVLAADIMAIERAASDANVEVESAARSKLASFALLLLPLTLVLCG